MLQETTISSEVVVLACSVHGLRDSRIEEEWKKKGLEGEGGGAGTAAMKDRRKSWVSSLNTLVGDRQESIVLMLSIYYSRENAEQRTTFASTAAMVAGTGAVAGVVAASATWTQPPPLSLGTPRRPPSPSVGLAPSTRPSATSAPLTVLYQSEHRSLGQRSIAPTGSATSWSQAPGVASSPGGSAAGDDWDDGDGLPATMAEEGVVHFSLPARISRGVEGGQMDEEEEDGAGMFTVALWQVFNRSRRVLVGSVTSLSWRDLSSVPNDSRKFHVLPGFQSERYPSAFLVVRRLPLGRSVPRPLSMSPAGVANPVVGRFNPIITYFTTLRRAAVASGPNALKDVVTLRPALSGDRHASVTSSHGENGKGGISDAVAAAGRWELVVCQELAVESKLTFKVPLQFLSPVHNALKRAGLAWRRRVLEERNRQGVFDTEEEAFANGRVLVRVSVSRARGLDAIAAGAAAAAVEAAEASTREGSDDLDVDNRQTSDPFVLPPAARGVASGGRAISERFSSLGGRLAGLGGGIEEDASVNGIAPGAGRGIGLGLGGIDRRRVSTSMRMLGGRVRGMGVRAVTMAKNASQASPTAHLRLGAASVHQKMLRQANFFVKVMYEPPPSPSPSSYFPSEEAFFYGEDISTDVPYAPAPEKVVGLTNTEYGSVEPVWGTNVNRNACPYNQPRLQHQVSGATRLEVVSNPAAPGGGGDGGEGREGQGAEVTGPRPDALAFSFYVAAKDLQSNNKPGGRLRLHLCQNMFSLKAGIADVPVGVVTVPLAENANNDRRDSVRRPRWREVESYDGSAVPAWSDGGEDFGGGLLGQKGSPQVLVGVSIQSRGATSSQPGSPRRQPLPVKASYSALPIGSGGDQPSDGGGGALGLGQVALGRIGLVALRLRGIGSGGASATTAGETAGAAATEFEIDDSLCPIRDLGGDWTKVGEDSDSDEEGAGGQTPAAATAAASTTIITPNDFVETLVETAEEHQEGESISLGGKEEAVVMRDCYQWMDSIGGPSPVLDTQALLELFSTVEYPVEWIEAHWRRVAGQRDRLVRILDLYSQRLAEGANFRSSLLKKDPLLQYVATNLHIQVWSISDPSTGKTRSSDMITTGAPAAHVIGFAAGGLVTLQAALQRLGTKVLGLKAACRECAQKGEPNRIMNQEPNIDRLRVALLEYELLSSTVAMRRVCVVSQAVTIAATSFCTKLEMMARGTLEIGRDLSSGGCADFDDLAKRWTTTGFLLGFEGLLSIHGKELGMVEDTVCALDMLADYQLQVVPANPDNPLLDLSDLAQLGVGDDAGGEFELEVGLEERTIKCIVGGASLKRLPRVLWDRGVAGCGGAGSAVVRIVPVLFTQGIDIQQSMSHASSSAKEKAAFQADINSANLARLNRYCHRIFPVSRPAPNRSANPGPVFGDSVGFEGTDGGRDLLDLGDFGEGTAGPAGDEKAARSRSTMSYRASESFPQLSHRISPGGSVPDWIHPALSELEAAVRDERVNHKNTAILLEAQLAVRGLCGGRVTFCKSGKDRTAMSVTLEEALLLAEHTSSQGKKPQDAGDTGAAAAGCGWRAADRSGALADANVLRAHGCRLMVAEKNIGYPLYSFNALQRQFIPELYQPPPQTIQDVITSALNRDS